MEKLQGMKRIILILLSFTAVCFVNAQDKSIVLMDSQLPYTSQTWFYSGTGNALQQDEIKKHWDEGRRITSVAHTERGWFVTMAKNTGIGGQTYNCGVSENWIRENWDKGYRISALASDNNKSWCIVMSQGTGYTQQTYKFGYWRDVRPWISERHKEGYYITSLAFTKPDELMVVMSKTPHILSQGYVWYNNKEEFFDKVTSDVWNKGYNVQLIGGNANQFFVIYAKYKDANGRHQTFQVFGHGDDVAGWISKKEKIPTQISYIGGGCEASSSYTAASNTVASNPTPSRNNNQYNGGGRIVKGQGYIGKGQDIHVMPSESGTITRSKRTLYYCNAACSPVKVTVSYYEPQVADPNNPFLVNMANQMRGWSLYLEYPGSGSSLINNISNYTFEGGEYVFRAKNGITIRLAGDLSYIITATSANGIGVKSEYRIPESDYNKFAQLQKNFLQLASLYNKKIEVEENETMSTRKSSNNGNSTRVGVWVKEYAPQYVFPAEQVWCEKCHEFDYRHVHYKKTH